MKALDYSLYIKVKEKFPAVAGAFIFVSLAHDNLEELSAIYVDQDERSKLRSITGKHAKEAIPYALIGSFSEGQVSIFFACRDFVQEEDLLTGKILMLSIGTYNNDPVDIHALSRDIQKMNLNILLSGNA